ncbi:beta type subunit of proteasome [Mitosporidium daphniae]|uniref:Proteasome subunit beta n=1 Tax=Mitosporidium daphniae TaxID=1485682 RepID=A0A098VLJ0_9MICR|nr:beta type subunit of proteasome [Mitosporidium daphniae]KGG49923.1 beta type subunit of proteasome [Mitosporidium daphniae]|eukprot:XP_013236388.1 beta type subunit of proteasome [Mitosporidium daphniae]
MEGEVSKSHHHSSILAIAGPDFCIVAADTRQSSGYLINCRTAPKAYKLTNSAVLATSGFHADGAEFYRVLATKIKMYRYKHERDMDIALIAQASAIQLYSRRFFPYYTFNVLGGIDAEGRGAVYSYDPVGSFEREPFRAGGSAAALIQPFLDNQLGKDSSGNQRILTQEKAIAVARDAFDAATERDIYTGDNLDVWVINAHGASMERFPLKRD